MNTNLLMFAAFAFFFQCNTFLFAQDFERNLIAKLDTTPTYGAQHFFQVRFHHGNNITNSRNSEVTDMFKNSQYNGYDLRIGFQTTGKKEWHRLLRYPEYGVGVSGYFFNNSAVGDLIGHPAGVYGFMALPLIQTLNHSFKLDLGLSAGLTYDNNDYDFVKNPYNDVVGSNILFYFNFDLEFENRISRRMGLVYGGSLIHFSNGRIRTPNLGINMIGVNVGLRYYFNPFKQYTKYVLPDRQLAIRPDLNSKPVPKFRDYWLIKPWTSIGLASTSPPYSDEEGNPNNIAGPAYFTSSTGFEIHRRYGGLGSAGIGISYQFDCGLSELYPDKDATIWQRSTLALGPLHEFFFGQFAIFTQVAWYLHITDEVKVEEGNWFLRVGSRIYLSEQNFIHFALKARDGTEADWVEIGFGTGIPFAKR